MAISTKSGNCRIATRDPVWRGLLYPFSSKCSVVQRPRKLLVSAEQLHVAASDGIWSGRTAIFPVPVIHDIETFSIRLEAVIVYSGS